MFSVGAFKAICCPYRYQDETQVKPYVDETTGTDLPDDMHDVIAEKARALLHIFGYSL